MHRDEVARLRAVRAAHLLLDDNLQLLLGLAGGGGAAGAGASKRTDAHHTCKNGSDLHFPVARASANGGAACTDSGEEEEGDVSCGTSKTEKTGLLTGSPHNAKKSCSEASCGHESKLSPCLLHTQDMTTRRHNNSTVEPSSGPDNHSRPSKTCLQQNASPMTPSWGSTSTQTLRSTQPRLPSSSQTLQRQQQPPPPQQPREEATSSQQTSSSREEAFRSCSTRSASSSLPKDRNQTFSPPGKVCTTPTQRDTATTTTTRTSNEYSPHTRRLATRSARI